MKGISVMVSAVLLIVIAVTIGTLVAGWFTTLSIEQSEKIENTTQQRLQCQFADMYIMNATYNCSGNCSAGNDHTLALGLTNSGRKEVLISRVVIKNTTGNTFSYNLNETKSLTVGNTITVTNVSITTCHGINNTIESILAISNNCPNTAFDSIPGADVSYVEC